MKKTISKALALMMASLMLLSSALTLHAQDINVKPDPVQIYLGKTELTNYLGQRQEYRQYEPPYYFPYDAYLASPYYFVAPEDNVYYISCCDYITTTGEAAVLSHPSAFEFNMSAVVYLKKGSRADFGFSGRANPSDNYFGNDVTEFGKDVGKAVYTQNIYAAKSPFIDNYSDGIYSIDFKKHQATLIKETYRIPDTVLGQKLTRIGEYAYMSTSNATSVTIPKNVTQIDEYAFSGCVKLKNVNIKNPNCVYYKNSFFNCRDDLKITGGKPSIKGKKPTVTSLSKRRKGFRASWKKVKSISGYQLQYATDKSFKKNKKTVTLKGAKSTSKSVSKLKTKKKYFVRVRSYKKYNGKKYYSAWSKTKSVKTR